MKRNLTMKDLSRIALAAALTAVCSWITIPGPVPFTLQTFAVFFSLAFLGGKRGTIAVALYLLLGAVGAPVFSGGMGGVEKLLGATGGYLFGFLFSALIYWLWTARLGNRKVWVMAVGMALGLAVCYAVGTAWFLRVYVGGDGNPVSLSAALGMCVLPFLPVDAVKIALAILVTKALRKALKEPAK